MTTDRTAVIEAMHARRSIRAYRPQAVERALLLELLWAAVQAPTPPVSGKSPWKICVIEGVSRLSEYGARAKRFARDHAPAGARWTWTERPDFEVFWNAPVAVVFCATIGNDESPLDCCRAAQNFVLAAHSAGLGTCWVGAPLPWLRSPDVAGEIGIPAGYEASAVILVGYAAEAPRGAPRPPPEVLWC